MTKKWASSKSKPAPSAERTMMATPPDPNRCFVQFSRILTAGTATVCLHSLARQVEKQPSSRPIEAIRFDPDKLVMEVLFAPLEGGEAAHAEHQGSAGR